jgi:hypothetical protein
MLCNEGFLNDAKSSASNRGMPGIRIIPESIPCECTVREDIEAEVDKHLDEIIAALVKPLTAIEKSPKTIESEKPTRIIFKGSLEEVTLFFYRRGWTDGLPIKPPTEEAVAEMLTGTDLPANHLIGTLGPRFGKATIEKVAINAAMAGALPTYMPLIIAGVNACLDPECWFPGWALSAGGWAPIWIINGPIRNDIHVNSGFGALSPGDIANAAIGRAMGLIIKNIGGIRKGVECMGSLGNPAKYSQVTGENEEESPWEPLHVEYGFNKEDSTITTSAPNSFFQVFPYGTDDKGILRGLLANITPGVRSPYIMMPPLSAKVLAKNGWTKKTIKEFICEYARVPAYNHPSYYGPQMVVTAKRMPSPLNPEDTMPIITAPDSIRIFVAGGYHNAMGLITGGGWRVTKKIELPANWNKLVQKYKDVVPTYAIY